MSDDDVPVPKKRKVGAHISQAQKNKLQSLMQEHDKLRCGKLSSTFTLKDAAKAWQNIALELNAIPGAAKDWKAWRKTWQDIYSKVKAKTAQVNRSQRQTGGGPPTAPLTQFEESVSALINPRVVSGHQESQESTVDFDFSQFDNEASGEETVTVYQIADDRENTNSLSQPQVPPRRTKINMKSLLKDKVEIKKKYYEEKLVIMKQKNDILKEINNNLVHLCDSFNRYTQADP